MFTVAAFVALIISLWSPGLFAQGTTTEVPSVSNSSSGGGGSSGSTTEFPPALPMIQSQDVLRQYALSIAKWGGRGVNAQTIDWDWPEMIRFTNIAGAYGEEVLDKLFDVEFVYRLTNPDDQISGYVYLYDGSFMKPGGCQSLLFYGNANYTLADLKTGKPQYQLWMQNIPLPILNASSAEVLALGEDGKTARREQISLNCKGQPMFPPYMAGAPNGILVVKGKDGSLVTYDFAGSVGEVPAGSSESASYKIEGHYVYTSNQKGGLPTIKITELWDRPSVFLEVGANEIITFDVMGLVQMNGKTEFERPTGFIFEQVDGPWAGAGPLLQDQLTQTSLTHAGKYRIRFEWKNFGKPNTLYTGPSDGGKG